MENNIIGEQISNLRNQKKITQEDLAIKLGYSKQTISNWETGLKTPRMGAIQKLADFFNVDKSFIIDGISDDMKKEMTIDEALDSVMSYDGKPLTDNDREVLKRITEAYLEGKLK